ncbi:MAG: spondin domain-containing protein [Planctomycetota bacterium]
MRIRFLPLLVSSLLAAPAFAQEGTATYRLTFQSTWSVQTHPSQFPFNPHYSPFVGGTHSDSVVFWEPGGLASSGIEQMAETGGTSLLVNEVNQQIAAGNADQALNFGGAGALANSPGQLSVTFTVDAAFPQLSLVTMVAPSPDWFVGVHGLELIQNDAWVDGLTLPAVVYDSGTDSGVSYNSSNQNTSPQDPIAMVATAAGPFAFGPTTIGTFTIERLRGTLAYGCQNPAQSLAVSGTPRLGQTLQFAIDDPTGLFPTPALTGLAMSTSPDAAYPCGTALPNFGMVAGMPGEVLLGTIDGLLTGPVFAGSAATIALTLPVQSNLIGQDFYFQGLLAESRIGLTRAQAVRVGQ